MVEIVIKGKKLLKNLSLEEMTSIKDDLTLINPAYVSAKKYSKYNYISIPKYLQYYRSYDNNSLIVPRGYKLPFSCEVKITDLRVENPVTYPEFVLELREEQRKAFKAYMKNPENSIISLPTGMGKSILGIYIASELKQKTLIIVQKDDLVTGWKKDIKLCFNDKIKVGLIKGKSREISNHITLATVQTLNKLTKEEIENLGKEFGLVILDELHHVPASSYAVIDLFPSKYRLGLTATPERDDGLDKVMNFFFGDIAYKYEYSREDNIILPVEVIMKTSPVVYTPKVTYKGREVFIDEIPIEKRPNISYHTVDDYVVRNKEYINLVCNDIINEYKQNRSIIVFFNQVEHCKLYFNELKNRGVDEKRIQIYAGSQKNENLLERAESKEVLITIATYKKATEGTNVKSWEVAFLVSSIKSEKNVEQAVGRIRRNKEGKLNPVRVYDYRQDFVYSMKTHARNREIRYRKLKFSIKRENFANRKFSRGFRN